MNDPATMEVWQTVFGKDFGGMAQGNNKTGQKGTNAMFVMTHNKIAHAYRENIFFTFTNPVVNYQSQNNDPNQIKSGLWPWAIQSYTMVYSVSAARTLTPQSCVGRVL